MEFLPDFGSALYTLVAFVVALMIIVTVHEFGHYIVGRWSGIKAEAFSIGFGPRLLSRVDKHGTRWQVSAIPLGGYVKFLGDANAASAGADEGAMAGLSPEEKRHTMHGAPLWARAVTVAAGPVFNFVLSIAIFAGMMIWTGTATDVPTVGQLAVLPGGTGDLRVGDRVLAIEGRDTPDYATLSAVTDELPSQPALTWRVERDGQPAEVSGPQLFPPRLSGVVPSSAAYAAGLAAGDVVTAIDGAPVWRFADLQQKVTASEGAPVALTVWRPGKDGAETLQMTLTPRRTDVPTAAGGFETRWMIGATGEPVFTPRTRPTGVVEAVKGGAVQTWEVVASSVSALKHMILGQISSCNLHGAIGIAQGSAAAAKAGTASFIWFVAVLSTAVGFLNLFPIPVLDGGHLMFHVWEAVTGKPPSDRAMNLLTALGLSLVLTMMLFGLWNDIFCP